MTPRVRGFGGFPRYRRPVLRALTPGSSATKQDVSGPGGPGPHTGFWTALRPFRRPDGPGWGWRPVGRPGPGRPGRPAPGHPSRPARRSWRYGRETPG